MNVQYYYCIKCHSIFFTGMVSGIRRVGIRRVWTNPEFLMQHFTFSWINVLPCSGSSQYIIYFLQVRIFSVADLNKTKKAGFSYVNTQSKLHNRRKQNLNPFTATITWANPENGLWFSSQIVGDKSRFSKIILPCWLHCICRDTYYMQICSTLVLLQPLEHLHM